MYWFSAGDQDKKLCSTGIQKTVVSSKFSSEKSQKHSITQIKNHYVPVLWESEKPCIIMTRSDIIFSKMRVIEILFLCIFIPRETTSPVFYKNLMNKQELYQKLIDTFFEYDGAKKDFLAYKNEQELKEILDLWDTSREWNQDWEDVFWYLQKYFQYCAKTDHPQFLNRMWTGANTPSVLWEMATVLTNVSACTYESAPVSTLMEKYMVSEMLKIVWFENGEWQMTTGSSNANMIAMMAARNSRQKSIKQQGVFGCRALFAFVNQESHYSLDKAANILGIGTDNLIKVPTDRFGAMDIRILGELLEEYSQKWEVFFVAATAGTTVRGAYDPISEIIKLRNKYGFWLHVDGAWWGPVFLSPVLRERFLSGIEEAESFCFDFHKMPGTALICNMLLINNKKWMLSSTCGVGNTDYIFKDHGDEIHSEDDGDLGVMSLQCGRRVESLKLFLDWKYYWAAWFAKKIEHYYQLCEYAENYIKKSPELQMMFPRVSFNLCFVYQHDNLKKQNILNEAIREKLYRESKSLVWSATIQGRYFLRLLICNEDITTTDIDQFFQNVIEAKNEIDI